MTTFSDFAEDISDFQSNIEQVEEAVDKAADDAARKTADSFQKDVKGTIRRKDLIDDGDLYRSIKVRKLSDGVYMVYTNEEHAPYVEYGRGPVEADEGGYLRFENQNGEIIYRKRVDAAEEQPFWRPNERRYRVEGILDETFEEELRDHVRRVFR